MRVYDKLTVDCEDGYLTVVDQGSESFTLVVLEDVHGGETFISLPEEGLESLYNFLGDILHG